MKKIFILSIIGVLVGNYCYCDVQKNDDKNTAEIDVDQNQRIDELWRKISELEKRISVLEQQNASVNNNVVSSNNANTEVAKEITNEEAEKIMDKVSSLIDEDGDDEARQEAKQLVTNFLNNYPKHLYVGQAHFYLGKILLDEQNHGEARHHFIKSVELNPKGKKAPEALYRLSVCLLHKENGKISNENKSMAKKVLDQLVNSGNYAGEYVEKGKKKLARLDK